MMTEGTRRRIKPTRDTPFHIDYEWWENDKNSLRIYLISHLPPEQQVYFSSQDDTQIIDWIDPETAEVQRVDGLQTALREASRSKDFLDANTSLVDTVFRVFLANGNTPLTPEELAEITGRSADMILRTLAGASVYKGLRPVVD